MRLPDATDHIRLAPVRALRAVFSGVGQLLLAADRLREEDARLDQETGEYRRDTLASWDGGLSPSVRLLSPTGMPVPTSRGARNAPDVTSDPTGRESSRAGGQQKRAAQPGRSPTGGPPPADSERADRSGKAAKPATKARNAGTGGRSGRPRNAADPSRFRSLDFTGNVRMLSDQDISDLAADQVGRSTAPAAPQAAALPISGYDDLSLPSLRARLRNLGTADLRDLLAHERSHANREEVVAMFERRIVKLEEAAGNRG